MASAAEKPLTSVILAWVGASSDAQADRGETGWGYTQLAHPGVCCCADHAHGRDAHDLDYCVSDSGEAAGPSVAVAAVVQL